MLAALVGSGADSVDSSGSLEGQRLAPRKVSILVEFGFVDGLVALAQAWREIVRLWRHSHFVCCDAYFRLAFAVLQSSSLDIGSV